eukprot:jgi/Botrbrau1/4836/Bobra.0325s0047.1
MAESLKPTLQRARTFSSQKRHLLKLLHVRVHHRPVQLQQRIPTASPDQVATGEQKASHSDSPSLTLRHPPAVCPWRLSWCDCCGDGCAMIACPDCGGEGYVLTEPGGAGVPFYVGTARCKMCQGMALVPCFLCGGTEVELEPPDPTGGPHPVCWEDILISDSDWLDSFPDSRASPAGPSRRGRKPRARG